MVPLTLFRKYTAKVFGTLITLVQYGCVAHCTIEYVGDFVVCSGPSMEPTIYTDNILLTEHVSPRLQKIQRGDIVIAKSPTNPQQLICKRVVGLAGDKISKGFSSHSIPLGHVWLEGDNQNNSADSRTFGPVPHGLIRSRAICKVWPPKEIQMLTDRRKWNIAR